MKDVRLLLIRTLCVLLTCFVADSGLRADSPLEARPLTEVLEQIEEAYHVIFTYDVTMLTDIMVDVEFSTDEELEIVVNRVLEPTRLRYKHVGDKYYIIYQNTPSGNRRARRLRHNIRQIQRLENSSDISLQTNSGSGGRERVNKILVTAASLRQHSVTGRVVNDRGEPLIGAVVRIKGSNIGVLTDREGNYSFSSPSDTAVLIASYIGYLPEEIEMGGQNHFDISLQESPTSLEEVVVIGYGTIRRSDVTGSVVTLGSREISEVPVSSWGQALQGRTPGILIQQISPRPGGGTQIRIRGNRSLGSDESGVNDPLVVLDGIPYSGSINDINPNDIASIDVLKDASATAIYGSRGANGVILISTRRGNIGKARLTYNGYHGVGSVLDKYELFNAEEYADLKQASSFGQAGGSFTQTEIQSMIQGRSTDWQDLIYKDSYLTNHELQVSGGTEATQYSISGGLFEQTAVLPGQKFNRISLRTALDQKIGNRIRIGLTSLNTISTRNGENANPMFQILTLSPLYEAYTEEGEVNELPAIGSPDDNTHNPLLLYRENTWVQERNRLRMFNSLYGEIELFKGVTYRINLGLDYWQDEYGEFLGADTPFRNGNGSTAAIRNEDSWSYTIENLLSYEKELGKHNLNVTGLFSAQEQENQRNGLDAHAVFADFLQFYNFSLSQVTTVPDGVFGYSKWGLLSGMARVNYDFDGRFLATATLRADGSSRLSDGNKWFVYPALALAWNMGNESFMAAQTVFSALKLRAGLGRTSNQAVAPYSSLGQLGRVTYNFGPDNGVYGFLVTNLPNSNLRWEFTTSANFGIDFAMFQNRISGAIDLYHNETDNVLQSRSLPITSGVPGSFQENVGRTRGQGIEVLLRGDIIRPRRIRDFRWQVDANFAAHQERILELAEGVQQDVGNGWFVGYPINVIYDYKKIGIWQLDEVEQARELGDFEPGDIKVADLNQDGIIDDEDRTVLGQLDPKWTAGLTTRFYYRGFDLSAVAFGSFGGNLVSTVYQMNSSYPLNSLEGRRNGPRVDYWTEDNPTNAFPETGNQITRFGSVMGYFDGSFMKIRTINLGYTLPRGFTDRAHLRQSRIYLTVHNPFKAFFSEYVRMGGIDPEPTGRGSSITPGLGRRLSVGPNTPPSRTFIVGVNFGI